jgi:hypothetical protein
MRNYPFFTGTSITGLSSDKKVGFSEGFMPNAVADFARASGEEILSI